TGVNVHDRLGDQQLTVHARHIVNATGIFAEEVEALTGTEPLVRIEPSKGVHLVLSREDLKLGDAAIVLPETEDKRILFIVPWESRAIFGTTDTGTGDLDHPTASKEDIAYVLNHRDGSPVVHPTQSLPLQGSAGWPFVQRELEKQGSALGLSHQTIAHLGKSYGAEAITILDLISGDPSLAQLLIDDLPYIRAEVVYATCYEMAVTPYDVLARRNSITLEDRRRG